MQLDGTLSVFLDIVYASTYKYNVGLLDRFPVFLQVAEEKQVFPERYDR